MTDPAAFGDDSNWLGGYYELAIEIRPGDDAHLGDVLRGLWSAADVRGCFRHRDREPEAQEAVPCTAASLIEFGYLHGRVRLPTGQLVVCVCMAIRGGDEGSDWLDLCVPAGALDNAAVVYGNDRPCFTSAVLDDWFADIGTEAFARAPFLLGVIGWEVSGCADASSLAGQLPQARNIGYLVPRGEVLHYGAANT
ncbi:hypothetical protein [Yinghuangia sp. YIM S10712]|uniref:hypothetical protein n=1 Tax=Yinghuangia sp. YIM S10712 TaxID=3436930 RepID=UPI003F53A23E